MTDFTSVLFSIGMFSGASAFFMGSITTTSFIMLFSGMFLSCFFGLLLYHVIVYGVCKFLEKLSFKK